MTKKVLVKVVIGLLVAILLLTLIHVFFDDWDGFFLNLITELIGLLVAIIFVDWVIKKTQEAQWQNTMLLINNQVLDLLRINSLYLEKLFDVASVDTVEYYSKHPERLKEPLDDPHYSLYMLSEVIKPRLEDKVNKFKLEHWKQAGILAATVLENLNNMLTIYSTKLDSEVFGVFLEIQVAARELIVFSEIMVKLRYNPNPEDGVIPIKKFVSACIKLGKFI